MPSDTFNNVFTVLGTLVLIVLIFVGAYWCAKLMGKHYGGKFGGGASSSMKILEKLQLSSDSALLVVRVKDQVLLLGASQQNITLLKELDPELYPEEEPPEGGKKSPQFSELFKNSLQSFGLKLPDKKGKKGSDK